MSSSTRVSFRDITTAARNLARDNPDWTLEKTDAGYVVRGPNGTASWHTSGGSDYRSQSNTEADLRRIGFFAAIAENVAAAKTNGRERTAKARQAADQAAVVLAGQDTTGAAAPHFSASSDDTARPAGFRGQMPRRELITPARAQELLDRPMTAILEDGTPLRQRPVYPENVQFYIGIIKRHEWKEMPQGVSFAADGSLLDGQHRLRAVVRTGEAQWFWVHYNVPPAYFPAFDTGKQRSTRDVLATLGETNLTQLGSALRLLTNFKEAQLYPNSYQWWTNWSSAKLTNDQIVRGLTDYPGIRTAVSAVQSDTRSKIIRAASAVGYYVANEAWPLPDRLRTVSVRGTKIDTDPLANFILVLAKGAALPEGHPELLNLSEGHPALTLREWANGPSAKLVRPRRESQLVLWLKCWNRFCEGKPVKLIKLLPSELMPTPYSPPG